MKKLVSLFLTVCMLLTLLPGGVLAEDSGVGDTPADSAAEVTTSPVVPSVQETPEIPANPTLPSDELAKELEAFDVPVQTDGFNLQSAKLLGTNTAKDSLNILALRQGNSTVDAAKTVCNVSKLYENIYLADYQATSYGTNLFTAANWFIIGELADGITITKIWANDTVALTGGTTEPFGTDGHFSLSVKAWNNGESSFAKVGKRSATQAAGCYYIQLSNGEVCTLVVLTNQITSGSEINLPPFINLFNDSKGEWLDGNYQITSMTGGRDTHLVETTLSSSTADAYRVQVINEGDYLHDRDGKTEITPYQFLTWRDMKTNQVLVNGTILPIFSSGDEDAAAGVLSDSFYLNPGMNVVEVRSGMFGGVLENTSPWFLETAPAWVGAIYLIDYAGPAADAPAEDRGTDTTLAYMKAVVHGAAKTHLTEAPLYWNGEANQYELVLPDTFRTPSEDATSFDRGVLLTVKPKSSGVTAQVLESDDNSGLVVGSPVGCVTALAMNNLKNLEQRFTVRVTAADGSTTSDYPVQVLYASSDGAMTSLSLENAALSPTFSGDVLDYYVDYASPAGTATLTLGCTPGASIRVDGTLYTEPVSLSATKDFHVVSVTAADGYTTTDYYLVTRLPGGEIPYSTVSPETKSLAKEMLGYYYKNLAPKTQFPSYWNIFGAKAAGLNTSGDEVNFDGKNVYDVSRHRMKQATDWGACILELVMLGQNPYDFPRRNGDGTVIEHFNYVEALQKQGGGPFANNVWYMMAANATGIDPVFTSAGKANALSSSYDLDTRAWWIAALSATMEPREMVRYVDSLHDAQSQPNDTWNADGKYTSLFYNKVFPLGWDNPYTNGCTFSAIASAGVDIERQFAIGGVSPLQHYKDHNMTPDGTFINQGKNVGMPKDIMIGLGDLLHGSNVWARYALTEEKYDTLISKAKTYSLDTSGMPTYGTGDYGKAYYTLYDQVADAAAATGDTSMRPKVTWGMPYQLFEDAVSALPAADAVTADHVDAVKAAIDQYEKLDDSNRQAVSLATTTKYRAVVAATLDVKDSSKGVSGLYTRIQALRDPLLLGESDRPEVEAIRKAYDAMDKTKQVLLDWAGKSVLLKLQKAEAALGQPGENPEKPQTMTISFRLLGAPNDGANGTVNTLKDGNLETWYTGDYTFHATSLSAEEVFRVLMGEAGIAWRGDSANNFGTLYISGIQNPKTGEWMEEFTTTANSGWMYTVNGAHPNVGVSDYTLRDGDKFIVHYTDDYTKEQGSEQWSPAEKPNLDPTRPSAGMDATLGKDGVASGTLSGDAVTGLVKAIRDSSDKEGTVVAIEVSVPKGAKGIDVAIPRAVLSALKETGHVGLEIVSDAGSMVLDPDALAAAVKAAGTGELALRMAPADTAKLSAENRALVGDHPVFEITLTAGGKAVSELGGKATVILPYTPPQGENAETLTVYHIDKDGKTTKMEGGRYDKAKKGMVFATPHLSTFAIAPDGAKQTPALPFTDVQPTDWFYDAVVYAYGQKLFAGTTETTFSPGGPMTRAMLVTVLWRLAGEPKAGQTAAFADVTADAWYAHAVTWANEQGIVTGTGAGFEPDGNVTREQIAAVLYRYAKIKGWDVTGTADLTKFMDGGRVSQWAVRAMQWANAEGLVTGKDGSLLDPAGYATRAEVAVILLRAVTAQ